MPARAGQTATEISATPRATHTPLEHACAYKQTEIVSWLVSEEVVDPRAVEYALRVAVLDADDANLRAITGMLVPNAVH